MHNAAVQAASGDFSFGRSEYFSSWVYQIGFTMYQALLIKLFGSSLVILKLMNVLFSVGTTVVIYFCGRKLFNESCGRIAALIYTLYIPNIIMCSVLTNQHLSNFLFLWGCLLVLNKGWTSKYNWIFIGLLFGLGNVMRPLGSIYLIGFVVFIFLFHLFPSIKVLNKSVFLKVLGVIAVMYLINTLVSYSFILGGVTKYPLSNREPYWKFAVGLNAETTGAWSAEDRNYVLNVKLGEERNKAELALVKERLQDKKVLLHLFANKLSSMWGSADGSTMWSLWDLNKQTLSILLDQIERAIYIAMNAYGVISIFMLLKAKRTIEPLFLIILILGFAAIYLVIEIQSRYRFDLMPIFIILQSFGVNQLRLAMNSLIIRQPKAKSVDM